jgi:phosphatidylglycerophosphatase A
MRKNKLNSHDLKKQVFSDWRYFLGFGFGSGLLPKMPGTWGTAIAIPLVYILSFVPLTVYLGFTVVYFILGTWLSEKLSNELGIHDYGGVNCDEVVGFLVLMLPFPCELPYLLTAFILFRFFDIIKPFPISWIDRHVLGGFGMMFDDIVAAGMSMLLMFTIQYGVHFIS